MALAGGLAFLDLEDEVPYGGEGKVRAVAEDGVARTGKLHQAGGLRRQPAAVMTLRSGDGPLSVPLPQKLGLALLEFRVRNDAPVSQIGQLGQLIGGALALCLEPLIPAGRLILRGVSCRDLLSG